MCLMQVCVKFAGELPAAMQHGGQLKLEYPLTVFLLSLSMLILGT